MRNKLFTHFILIKFLDFFVALYKLLSIVI
jgi:hypothetical protein